MAGADGLPDDGKANPAADPVEVAREIALRRLALRAHSRAELADAMRAKLVPDEIIDQVLERFSEVNLVDDADFARQWTQSRHQHQLKSKRMIAEELRRKGVDRDLVSEAVAEIDHDSELDAARQLAAKKLRSLARLEPQVSRRRLTGALARKGFGSSIVSQVVRETLHELSETELSTE